MPFAWRLPLLVVGELLEVPRGDIDRIHEWSSAIGRNRRGVDPDALMPALDAIAEFREYVETLLAEHRGADHRSGLLTALLGAGDEQRLSADELTATFVILLFAGHETTTGLLTNGMIELLRHPGQWRALCADPGLAGQATEELLRFVSPVQWTWRVVARPYEVAGTVLPTGTTVGLLLAAANRDPEVFADPETLDLRRLDAGRHVAFGLGPHFCLGNALARLEAEIAFGRLAQRFPGMTLGSGPIRWRGNAMMRQVQALPVSLGATDDRGRNRVRGPVSQPTAIRSDRIRARGPAEHPERVEEITPQWLTAALAVRYPGTEVLRVDIGTTVHGSGTKVRLLLEYNAAGHGHGLPPTMWIKAGYEPHSDMIRNSYVAEKHFYRAVGRSGVVNAPYLYFGGTDSATGHTLLLLEDLLARNATFGHATAPLDLATVERALAMMARYHGLWWGAPELATLGDFGGAFVTDDIIYALIDSEGWERWVAEPRGSAVPERVSHPRRDPQRIRPAVGARAAVDALHAARRSPSRQHVLRARRSPGLPGLAAGDAGTLGTRCRLLHDQRAGARAGGRARTGAAARLPDRTGSIGRTRSWGRTRRGWPTAARRCTAWCG